MIRRLVVAALLALGACASPRLEVMSFNVRYADDRPPHAWETRAPAAAALIDDARPDLVGTQELLRRQGDDLVAALPGYRWFGRDRRGGRDDEHMGILYRADRLRLVEEGDFWLSDTPGRPGSMAWGADLPRMATWGVFETVGARPRRFLFLNTHLAHRPQDAGAREASVRLILDRLPALAGDLPVIVAGDFNAEPDSAAYRLIAEALADVRTAAPRRSGPEGTYHGYDGPADRRIDYLFVRGFVPLATATLDARPGGVQPSDHHPVTATLRFGR